MSGIQRGGNPVVYLFLRVQPRLFLLQFVFCLNKAVFLAENLIGLFQSTGFPVKLCFIFCPESITGPDFHTGQTDILLRIYRLCQGCLKDLPAGIHRPVGPVNRSKVPVSYHHGPSELLKKADMVFVTGNQMVPNADFKDAQHAKDVDFLCAVRLMHMQPIPDQHIHEQHKEPRQSHPCQQGDPLSGTAACFPKQKNKPCDKCQDHPCIQQIETKTLGVFSGNNRQFRKTRFRIIYQIMQIICQHHQRQKHRGNHQQPFVPSFFILSAPVNSDA